MASVQAELKSFGTASMDVPDYDLRAWQPENQRKFSVYVEAEIGSIGDVGSDIFGFDVCSPMWLVDESFPKGYAFCRLLLMEAWSYARLEQALTELCNRTAGDTWRDIASKLSRFSDWEFEDYQRVSA